MSRLNLLSLFRSQSTKSRRLERQQRTSRRFLLETLENRWVMSGMTGMTALSEEPSADGIRQFRPHAEEQRSPVNKAADSALVTSKQQVVEFDPLTRTERVLSEAESQAAMKDLLSLLPANSTEGFAGILAQAGIQSDLTNGYVHGADGRTLITDTTSYPWSANGRLWQDFPAGEFAGSAVMVSPFHILTAAHCVHEGSGGDWANDLVYSAGQGGTNIDGSFRRSDNQPFGEASWQRVRTFTGWTQNGNFEWDIALVTLDRNLGNFTGWFGYGYNSDDNFYNGTANTSGYPGDLTPQDYDMYYQSGNARSYNIDSQTIRTNTMDVWPGQSGSGVYYIQDTGRIVHAIVSHQAGSVSNPVYNGFARINQGKFDSIQSWRAEDEAGSVPTDRPELVDYDTWYDSQFASLSQTSALPGDQFTTTMYVRNNGTAAAGNFSVRFRLSSDPIYDTGDTLLGDAAVGSLNPFNFATVSLTAEMPYVSGNYYVVYSVDPDNVVAEYTGANHQGAVSTQITALSDFNDQMSEAANLALGISNGTIDSLYDVDMYAFNVAAGQRLTFDIDNPAGVVLDSGLRIFDSFGNQLAISDDDIGPAPEETIREAFLDFAFSQAGTYYLGVSGFSNFGYSPLIGDGDVRGSIGSYTLEMATVNGAPVVDDQNFAIDEGALLGASVGTVLASDPDGGQSLLFEIAGGNTSDAFAIDPATGEITVANAAAIDFETNATFSLEIRVTDDGNPAQTDTAIVTIAINKVNENPLISSLGGPITYRENAPAIPVASIAVVSDADSLNFAGGRLTVRLLNNSQPADRLVIRPNGNVTVSGANVLFAGQVVGTFTGGAGSTPLVIVFNGRTNPFRAQAILRSVTFQHLSENPSANARTVQVVLTDGEGGTSSAVSKAINVVPVNDAPRLTPINGGSVGYRNGQAPIALLGTATVADPDSANFAGGRLQVRATAGGHFSNRLEVSGAFTLVGNEVRFNGQLIGTRNANGGVGTTALQITLNANATRPIVEQLVRSIRFRTVGGVSTAQRAFQFQLTDGDGGTSNTASKIVNVSN